MCALSFSETFVWNISHSKKNWAIVNVYWSLCKLPIIFVRFEWNLNFLNGLAKNASNFMEIRQMVAEDGRTDSQTDRHDEGNSRFVQLCEHA